MSLAHRPDSGSSFGKPQVNEPAQISDDFAAPSDMIAVVRAIE